MENITCREMGLEVVMFNYADCFSIPSESIPVMLRMIKYWKIIQSPVYFLGLLK